MGSVWNYNSYEGDASGSYTNGTGQRAPFVEQQNEAPEQYAPPMTHDPNFDILEWHPAYQSCQRYFLDHAQHEPGTQALCALINIRLPCQWLSNPITTSIPAQSSNAPPGSSGYNFNNAFAPRGGSSNLNSPNRSRTSSGQPMPTFVSLIPYIRRLVITAFDKPPILHGFFGDDYVRGVLPHVDCERRNYLFAAKHGGWRSCKKQYDNGSGGGGDESVPFMKPLDEARMEELTAAEKAWSGWLAMEDWMVGPRAPDEQSASSSQAQGHGQSGGGGVSTGRRHDQSNGVPDGVGEGNFGAH